MTQAVIRSSTDANAKAYDPIFYANEAITQLYKALGMANAVHRGYDRTPAEKGSTIQIRLPGTFTAQDAPSSAQEVTPSLVNIELNYWKEVKFGLTDKEITLTDERIISDHIAPAAYALADDIDSRLCALYKEVPWYSDLSAPAAVADITAARKIMFNNKVPMKDTSKLHIMVDGTAEAEFLNLSAFSQQQGAGQAGVDTQVSGFLGQKFGFNFFANQNVKTHTTGTLSATDPLVNTDTAVGATSIILDKGTLTGTIVAGDILTFAGHTQQYVATALATASGNAITVNIAPAVTGATIANDTQATVVKSSKVENLAFHSHFAALAMAPLSEMASQLGAKVATVTDPVTNISIRSRVFYEGNNSKVFVALDVLYGIKVLDCNKATRIRD